MCVLFIVFEQVYCQVFAKDGPLLTTEGLSLFFGQDIVIFCVVN